MFRSAHLEVLRFENQIFILQFLSTCHTDLALPSLVLGITSDAIEQSCFFVETGPKNIDVLVTPLLMKRATARKYKGIASTNAKIENIYTFLHLYTTIYSLYTKTMIQISNGQKNERV